MRAAFIAVAAEACRSACEGQRAARERSRPLQQLYTGCLGCCFDLSAPHRASPSRLPIAPIPAPSAREQDGMMDATDVTSRGEDASLAAQGWRVMSLIFDGVLLVDLEAIRSAGPRERMLLKSLTRLNRDAEAFSVLAKCKQDCGTEELYDWVCVMEDRTLPPRY